MRLIPFESETIVSSASKASVISLIESTTDDRSSLNAMMVFTGKVHESSFKVSLNITKPQSFIPLIEGTVDQTSSGSLIFVKYRFFPGTIFFLSFWSLITVLMAVIFFGPAENYLYGSLSLLGCIANYLIAMANFDVHLTHTKKALHKVFDSLT